jgi:phosphoglucosamine mutase
VTRRGCAPNGRNINDGVGALHPPAAISEELAICLDGDGDRLAIVDRTLGALDGDDLLYFLAGDGTVVGTVMTNGGLEKALGPGRLVRAPVVDRFVAEAMRSSGAAIGGEPSGISCSRRLPTSSGSTPRCGPSRCLGGAKFPTTAGHSHVRATRSGAAKESADAETIRPHRVIVRKSGTEPLVRVMVEETRAEEWRTRSPCANRSI